MIAWGQGAAPMVTKLNARTKEEEELGAVYLEAIRDIQNIVAEELTKTRKLLESR